MHGHLRFDFSRASTVVGSALAFVCAAALTALAQTPAAPVATAEPSAMPSARVAPTAAPLPKPTSSYEALLGRRLGEGDGVGLIVGTIDGDTTTISQAGSLTGAELSPDTLFEIGSVTKTFTATLLALMTLDGEVALDDPVQKYLPSNVRVPTFGGKAITLLALATQRSGLPRLPTNMDPRASDPYADYTTAKLYAFLNGYTLTRAPGATFEYSNLGIGLLGTALANRAHLSYEELLQRRVLRPLGMTSTTTLRTPAVVARMAIGHDADGNPARYWRFAAIAPAGAIVSSVDDMLKYARCNLGLGPLARACLFAQRPRAAFPGHKIGLVWWLDDDGDGPIEHGGDTFAFHAGIAISPDHTKAAVALTNGGLGAEDVALNAVDPSRPLAFPQRYLKLAAADLAPYVGTYVGLGEAAGVRYVVEATGGALSAALGTQPSANVYPIATDAFAYKIVAATMKFVRDPAGAIVGLRLYQNGKIVAFARDGTNGASLVALGSPTPLPAPVSLDAATLAGYAGVYRSDAGAEFTVEVRDTALFVKLASQPFYEVFASAKDRFYYKVVDAQVEFSRDAAGAVTGLTLHQNGRDVAAPRLK